MNKIEKSRLLTLVKGVAITHGKYLKIMLKIVENNASPDTKQMTFGQDNCHQ